jgi:hypothetical protein
VAVHHINVNDIGTGDLDGLDLVTKPGKVG